jgi:hypothetical protein
MAALDFPDTPSVGQLHGSAGALWRWDGTRWAYAAEMATAKPSIIIGRTHGAINVPGGGSGVADAVLTIPNVKATDKIVIHSLTLYAPATAAQGLVVRYSLGGAVLPNLHLAGIRSNTSVDITYEAEEVVTGLTGNLNLDIQYSHWYAAAGQNMAVKSGYAWAEIFPAESVGGLAPGPWTTIALTSPWTHDSGGGVQYRMNGDNVEWRGRCNSVSAVNTPYFTVPVGFRPPSNQPFAHATVLSSVWGAGVAYFQANGVTATLITNHLAAAFNGISYSISGT